MSSDAPFSSSSSSLPPQEAPSTASPVLPASSTPQPDPAESTAAVPQEAMEAGAGVAKEAADDAAATEVTTAEARGMEPAAAIAPSPSVSRPEPSQPRSTVDRSSDDVNRRTESQPPLQSQAIEPGLESLFESAISSSGPRTTLSSSSSSAAVPVLPLLQQQSQQQQQHLPLVPPPSQSKAVHPNRKHDLLLQAREDRARWISQVPAPARDPSPPTPHHGRSDGGNAEDDALWNTDPRFQAVATLPAVQRVPSALPLLTHLYRLQAGNANENEEDAVTDDGPTATKKTTRRAEATAQRLQALLCEVAQDDGDDGRSRDRLQGPDGFHDDATHLRDSNPPPGSDLEYWKAYRALWHQFHDPSRASLVQGMRAFCRPHQQQQLQTSASGAGGSNAAAKDWSDASQKIRSYAKAAAAAASAASHGTLEDGGKKYAGSVSRAAGIAASSVASPPLQDQTRRALEAFLHGQCRERIVALGWTDEAQRRDSEWKLRWGELQFVGPKHLDVACLARLPTRRVDRTYTNDDDPPPALYLEDALDEAVQALQAVDLYHSPFDKLQQILAVYRCVNATLAKALNPATSPPSAGTFVGEAGAPHVLPSADDVLPTVILTVLRAKPDRLPFNLQFVEQCCLPDALRGEAGYAYTNLYGAVQFLLDLDLERPGAGLSSSIDPDEFRRSWQACRDKAVAATAAHTAAPSKRDASPPSNDDAYSRLQHAVWTYDLPPRVVRDARRHGESLDVDWALEWWQTQAQQQRGQAPPSRTPCGLEDVASVAMEDPFFAGGLTRSHRFLTARPDDVRLSDLPDLLEEYRTLVHATERLRGERAAKVRAERKAQRRAAEQALLERAKDITPLLDAAAATLKGEAVAPASETANTMSAGGVVLNGTHRGGGGPTTP